MDFVLSFFHTYTQTVINYIYFLFAFIYSIPPTYCNKNLYCFCEQKEKRMEFNHVNRIIGVTFFIKFVLCMVYNVKQTPLYLRSH